MLPRKSIGSLLLCLLASSGFGQTITSGTPPVFGFVDISTTGGTAISGVTDDSEHDFMTTIGNGLFPAGPCRIGNNGAVMANASGTGDVPITNLAIPATGVPSGMLATAAGIICAYWDDLYPPSASANQTIWIQEGSGVLIMMWKNEDHFGFANLGQTITFEIQVFGSPAPTGPWIQILYPDATFGGTAAANDNGASATVGYVKAANPIGGNVQWSFNTAGSIPDGITLSIYPPMTLAATSPFGPGSLQIDIGNGPAGGTYFLCVTLNAGAFPSGYFFGITPSLAEVLSQATFGFPFVGPLDGLGNFTIGPIAGLPSGFTFYDVVLGFDTPVFDIPTRVSAPRTYSVP